MKSSYSACTWNANQEDQDHVFLYDDGSWPPLGNALCDPRITDEVPLDGGTYIPHPPCWTCQAVLAELDWTHKAIRILTLVASGASWTLLMGVILENSLIAVTSMMIASIAAVLTFCLSWRRCS